MTDRPGPTQCGILAGRRIAFVGPLASMGLREAHQLVARHGAIVCDALRETPDVVVWGEADVASATFDSHRDRLRQEASQGRLDSLTETQLWQALGLVESEDDARRLYTPAMLAQLLNVPVACVRRWQRRGLIMPVQEVRRLAYFDFREVAVARRLAELTAAGISPTAIERQLEALARRMPGVKRPLAELSVVVEGKQLLIRGGEGLSESTGQLRLDFGDDSDTAGDAMGTAFSLGDHLAPRDVGLDPDALRLQAAACEDAGELASALEAWRLLAALTGPRSDTCFAMAELLYRMGDLPAARERYYMALELDENLVEARANLGCVLGEMGQTDLAVAAFEGALALHADYADAHFHLARTLDEASRQGEALTHWKRFLELAPASPWVESARSRLAAMAP